MASGTQEATYQPVLDLRQTERAIRLIKEFFQINLAAELNLARVSAPLLVPSGTGLNDNLNGVERPVSFPVKSLDGRQAEIVQSLAKWKRLALAEYGFRPGEGLYTDMNAIRPDEDLDETHSIYVDQWDWELILRPEERNLSTLLDIVQRLYSVIRRTEQHVALNYSQITTVLPSRIHCLHALELARLYPDLPPREREHRICQAWGAVFVIGIGAPLADGNPHDGRAPDYDDWTTTTELGPGLNGDILVWNPVLGRALELSSMGIRVDPETMRRQLALAGNQDREHLMFHRRLLAGELPQTIGGGIGQSRLCMFFLRKAHIGEVQAGLWPEALHENLARQNILLL